MEISNWMITQESKFKTKELKIKSVKEVKWFSRKRPGIKSKRHIDYKRIAWWVYRSLENYFKYGGFRFVKFPNMPETPLKVSKFLQSEDLHACAMSRLHRWTYSVSWNHKHKAWCNWFFSKRLSHWNQSQISAILCSKTWYHN